MAALLAVMRKVQQVAVWSLGRSVGTRTQTKAEKKLRLFRSRDRRLLFVSAAPRAQLAGLCAAEGGWEAEEGTVCTTLFSNMSHRSGAPRTESRRR